MTDPNRRTSFFSRLTKRSKTDDSASKDWRRNGVLLTTPEDPYASSVLSPTGSNIITLIPSNAPSPVGSDDDEEEEYERRVPGLPEQSSDLSKLWTFKDHNTYRYEALASEDHFRVIELQPGAWTDKISFILRTVSWQQKPEYEAISYAWGDLTNVRSSSNEGKDFKITTSLFEALQHFRYEDRPRTLWADAVW
jgi:hypothetical protein